MLYLDDINIIFIYHLFRSLYAFEFISFDINFKEINMIYSMRRTKFIY